ncbi:MAG: marine proteobacterial sortase target protein [Verrucomicrobia bacterium]|jgi:Ca-activated chloride channel family protein|nr:marine proteobacterial sortase target protein [Verrucomicrobiota bacterium]
MNMFTNYFRRFITKPQWLMSIALVMVASVLMAGCAKRKMKMATPIPGSSTLYGLSRTFAASPAVSSVNSLATLIHSHPSSLPSRDEELWVISKSASVTEPIGTNTNHTVSSLICQMQDREVALPLKHTDVQATISAYIASVNVTQQFHNPYDQKIEAVYVFPLPHNAAVNEFIMTIGERRIRGIIRDRQEAEEIYQAAKQQGYTASLLTQERPNIFTQSVANIEPGKQVDIFIRYFHTLAYDDGWYEFVFPMVVGPRFNPPGSKDGVGSVARGKSGASGQGTEVSYLKPGERSGHDISVSVDLHAGVKVEGLTSRSHALNQVKHTDDHLTVTLNPNDTIPNKDLVVRYKVAGEKLKANWLSHKGEKDNYFTLMLYPPKELQSLKRHPLELVFVLDCSGSMNGRPLEQAKAAIARALQQMQPDDTFQLINFSNDARQLGNQPLPATPQNIRKGLDYLAKLNSEGGTMMIEGIKAALDFPHDAERLRFVCFLTDGYIGNENEILAEINKRLDASRIFSFGIGSSVNRFLMDSMAKAGRGTVAYLGNNESAADLMDLFMQRISHPALTDIAINWNGLQVTDVFPKRLPDLFPGRPVIITGKYQGQPNGSISLLGYVSGQKIEMRVPVKSDDSSQPGLAAVWARHKIASLAEEAISNPSGRLVDTIKQVALDHNLMSAFTAFVAVDASRKTAGESAVTTPVSVPTPEGVSFNKTVPEK